MSQLFFKSKWVAAIFVSIILILLCIPPFNCWWLSFLVLAPVFYALEKQSYRQSFFLGTLYGFFFYFGIFYWIIPSVASVSGIHWILSSLLCLTIFLLLGLAYGLLFLLLKYCLRHWLYLTPFLLPAFEFLFLPVFPVGIGYVWGDSLIGAQIADIGGIYFLSFITCVYGLLLFLMLQKKVSLKKGGLLVSLLILLHFGYGFLRYTSITNAPTTDSLKVMIIQPAIPAIQKRDEALKTYLEVMNQLAPAIEQNKDVDLFILPESIFVPIMKDNDHRLENFKKILRPTQAICWGCNTSKKNQYFNSIGFLDNTTQDHWKYYQKQNLLFIGEHIPFIDDYPDLKKAIEKATHINQFSPGEKLVGFEKKSFKILPSICFENMFSVLMAKKIKELKGVDLLLNISEDGWFGDSNALPLHYFVTKLRAIEFRKPLVRSLNIGISAIVDERGIEISKVKNISDKSSQLTKTKSFEKSTAFAQVNKKSIFSFYGMIGYFFPYLCSLIFIFTLGQAIRTFQTRNL